MSTFVSPLHGTTRFTPLLEHIPRPAIFAAITAVALAITAASGRAFTEKLAVARAEAATARATATRSLKEAADASSLASAFRVKARLLADSTQAATARAAIAERNAARLRGSFTALAQTVPDTCRALAAAADSVLGAQDTVITQLHAALQSSQEARSVLETALDTTTASLSRLSASTTNLVHADAILAKQSRPSFLARITPHPGIGAAIGFDATGVPRVVIGFTLGWKL